MTVIRGREIREHLGMSKSAIAKLANVRRESVRLYEELDAVAGQLSSPSAVRLRAVYGVLADAVERLRSSTVIGGES